MALHNFIRISQFPDIDFNHASQDDIDGQQENNESQRAMQAEMENEERNACQYMQIIRNEIASLIWASQHQQFSLYIMNVSKFRRTIMVCNNNKILK